MEYLCPRDAAYQNEVGLVYGALLTMPFEERGNGDRKFILDIMRHTKECKYHNRSWYDAFVDFMEQRTSESEIPGEEFPLLRRNLDLIFAEYL